MLLARYRLSPEIFNLLRIWLVVGPQYLGCQCFLEDIDPGPVKASIYSCQKSGLIASFVASSLTRSAVA